MRRWFVVTLALTGVLLLAAPAAGQEAETSVRGRLSAVVEGDRQGVPGVEIVVARDGDEIASVTTDEEGSWEVPLPTAGTYSVTLVTDSLPEGLRLADGAEETAEVEVATGQRAGRAFMLTTAEAGSSEGGGGSLGRALGLAVEGLKLGAVIAMTAVGLSLIYGVTGLINFAHGELVTFGAVVAWFLNAAVGGPGLQLVLAAVLAVLAGGVLGFGMERGLFSPLRRRGTGLIALIVISIGLSLLLRHLYLVFFGGGARPYLDYAVQRAAPLGPIQLPPKDYAIIAISVTVLVTIGLLLQRTQLGMAMRAVADDRDLAEASGIDVRRVILATWVGGAALAALGGVLQGVTERVSWDMGFTLLLLMFAAVVLGGLGTGFGAMVGGLVIGLVTQLSTLWVSVEFKSVVALVVLVAVLLVRPQGILGRAERIG